MYRAYIRALSGAGDDKATHRKKAKDRRPLDKKALICGDLAVSRNVGKRALRLFISSTFTDTKAERNYFMAEAFPELYKYCENKGIEFSVVDMRWGIRDSSTNDHLTTEICLSEIEKCKQVSIDAPWFIYLSCQKYGYKPLQRIIDSVEFEHLVKEVADDSDKELLFKWYNKDNNAVPAVYVLQPVSTYIEGYGNTEDPEIADKHWQQWSSLEKRLKTTLTNAALLSSKITQDQRDKWSISITEQEVGKAFSMGDGNLLCLVRNISDLPDYIGSDDMCSKFIDVADDKLDVANQRRLDVLRKRVKENDVSTVTFSTKWKSREDVVKPLVKAIQKELEGGIDQALKNTPLLNEFEIEVVNHSAFCLSRAESFQGRNSLVIKAVSLLTQSSTSPCILYGKSGAGKTSLVSKAVVGAQKVLTVPGSSPVTIVRFSGTSPKSSSIHLLLQNICQQILLAYDTNDKPIPSDFTILKAFFKEECLSLPSHERPLILAIDSLDQLSDEDRGRSDFSWLPVSIPENVHLLVSTIPEVEGHEIYNLLQETGIPEHNFLEVPHISADDAEAIFREWFKDAKRTLQPDQYNQLLKGATDASEEEPTALRLRLLFDIFVKLAHDDVLELKRPVTVSSLLDVIFNQLEHYHGSTFVSACFACLSLSKHGLSSTELLDILSGNDAVLESVLQYHQPPVRRIPYMPFARLRNDVKEYIVERGTYGKTVMNWYHRQFWEYATNRYITKRPDLKKTFSELMVKYFSGALQVTFQNRGLSPQTLLTSSNSKDLKERLNMRRLSELPWILCSALSSGSAYAESRIKDLINLNFVAANIEAGQGQELMRSLKNIMECQQESQIEGSATYDYTKCLSEFVFTQMHNFDLVPEIVIQQALLLPKSNQIYQEATHLTQSGGRPWLLKPSIHVERITEVNVEPDPCVSSIDTENHGHSIVDMVYTKVGKRNSYIFVSWIYRYDGDVIKPVDIIHEESRNVVTTSVKGGKLAVVGENNDVLIVTTKDSPEYRYLVKLYRVNYKIKDMPRLSHTISTWEPMKLVGKTGEGMFDYFTFEVSRSNKKMITGILQQRSKSSISLYVHAVDFKAFQSGGHDQVTALLDPFEKEIIMDDFSGYNYSALQTEHWIRRERNGVRKENYKQPVVSISINSDDTLISVVAPTFVSVLDFETLTQLWEVPFTVKDPVYCEFHRHQNKAYIGCESALSYLLIYEGHEDQQMKQKNPLYIFCLDKQKEKVNAKLLLKYNTEPEIEHIFDARFINFRENQISFLCNRTYNNREHVGLFILPQLPSYEQLFGAESSYQATIPVFKEASQFWHFENMSFKIFSVCPSDSDPMKFGGFTGTFYKFWDLSKIQNEKGPMNQKKRLITLAAVSDRGDKIVLLCRRQTSGHLTRLSVWDVQSGACDGELCKDFFEDAQYMSFSPNNKFFHVASGTRIECIDGQSILADPIQIQVIGTLQLPTRTVTISYINDDYMYCRSMKERSFSLAGGNVVNMKDLSTLNVPDIIGISSDGKWAFEKKFKIISWPNKELIGTIDASFMKKTNQEFIEFADVIPNSNSVLLSTHAPAVSGTKCLINAVTFDVMSTSVQHKGVLKGYSVCAYSKDGRFAVTFQEASECLSIYRLPSLELVATIYLEKGMSQRTMGIFCNELGEVFVHSSDSTGCMHIFKLHGV